MSAWDRVVRAALLGTERQAAPEDASTGDPALDGAVAALADRPAEARLLGTAALLDSWRRAGRRPGRTDETAPPPAPEVEERLCAPPAAAVLRQLLAGAPPPLLAEWLALADAAGVAIPHELLPAALNFGARHSAVRGDVARALGPRGRWLAALNPAWAYAAAGAEDPAAGWESGTGEERVRILRHLRASDPAAGLALLRSTWQADAPRDRAAFLDELSVGLGMDDEPFLESVLDDRRKEVRAAAARLLSTLPDSRLVARMRERLGPLLRVHVPDGVLARLRGQGARIDVELPAACDKAMQRDGIEPRPPHGTGERAWWLHQMISAVPPSFWTAAWEMDADACIRAARAGAEPGTLVRAWRQAAVQARDAAWAEALLRAGAGADEHSAVQALAAAVPPHRLDPLALELVDGSGRLRAGTPAAAVLEAARFPWSAALTRAVVQALPPKLEPSDYALRERLRGYAFHMHPAAALAALAERDDPQEGPWIDLLHLRHTLHQAFG